MTVYSRLKFFEYLFILLKYLLIFSLIYTIYISILSFITIKSNNTINTKVNTELIIKPILQVNDDDNNLTYAVSKNGLIQENYTKLTLNDVNLKNDFLQLYAKEIIYHRDEIILKNRPNILFYNNY